MSFIKTTTLLLLGATLGFTSCGRNLDAARIASDARASEGEAQALYDAAYAAERAGNAKKAIKGYDKLTKNYPMAPIAAEAQYRDAKLRQATGEPFEAFESYDTFLKNHPLSDHYTDAIKQQEIIAYGAAQGIIKDSTLGIKSKVGPSRTTKMLEKIRDNAPRSPSAEKAQFTIGSVFQNAKRSDAVKAIDAYRALGRDYPNSSYAPEAQFQIGNLLLAQAQTGNQDSANLDQARSAFEDLLQRYPNSKRAPEARRQIANLASSEIQSSFDIAEFYRKKGQNSSAIHYYNEVMRTAKPGPLRSQAAARITELGG